LYWVARSDLNRLPARVRRLFACACVRRIWHCLPDERSRRGVEALERFADGELSRGELDVFALLARAAADERSGSTTATGARAAERVAADEALDAVEYVAWTVAQEIAGVRAPKVVLWGPELQVEADRQERRLWDLMEDVLTPDAPPIPVDWLTPTVVGLARRIYDSRDFALLPVLADALEDAGCDDERLRGHLRGGGEHIRGCWALDALLGLREAKVP
jgi:hypothetical protein